MFCSPMISHISRRFVVRGFLALVAIIALAFAFSTSDIQHPASAQSLGARWTSTNAPPFSLGTMTRLLDGKVISVGVTTSASEPLRRVGIYDPLTDTWRETTPMNYHRILATSILLFDGRLLVVGGTKNDPGFQLPAGPPEIFDPSTEKWTEVQVQGSDTNAEFFNMWTRSNIRYMPNGKVLTLSQIYSRAYLFDPMTGEVKRSSQSQTLLGNDFPSSTILHDGKVLFLSNRNSRPQIAEIFDPETELWSTVDLPTSVDTTVAGTLTATLPDGKALGLFRTPINQRVSLAFDPVAKSWGDMAFRYSDNTGALRLPTGELFAFRQNVAEIYNATSKFWRTVDAPTKSGFFSVLLASGQAYKGNEIYGVDFGSLIPAPALTGINTSAASFRVEPLARGSIVSLFGSNLTGVNDGNSSALASDISSFNIIDGNGNVHPVRRVFTSAPNQINYLMPDDVLAGQAMMILAGSGNTHVAKLSVVDVAPGLFTADASGKGTPAALALRVRADGSQSYESIVNGIDLGGADELVFLVLFGTGIQRRTSLDNSLVYIGGVKTPPVFVGRQGDFDGLDQINVQVPRSLAGRGDVDALVTIDGKMANPVRLRFK